jgi:hypothetical protein
MLLCLVPCVSNERAERLPSCGYLSARLRSKPADSAQPTASCLFLAHSYWHSAAAAPAVPLLLPPWPAIVHAFAQVRLLVLLSTVRT